MNVFSVEEVHWYADASELTSVKLFQTIEEAVQFASNSISDVLDTQDRIHESVTFSSDLNWTEEEELPEAIVQELNDSCHVSFESGGSYFIYKIREHNLK